jgi:PAT family beta-lactamase induction signal transducer AmpG
VLATTVPITVHREPPRPAPAGAAAGARRGALAAVGAALARPGMGRWLAVLATFKTGEWFANGMLRPFLTDAKLTVEDIGVMLGFVGFGAALLGAAVGGVATRGLGRRRALLAFGSLQAVAIAAIGVVALAERSPSEPVLYAVMSAEHFTSAMATTALFTAMMDFCRIDEAGTDYTLQASVVVIATGIASVLSGVSAEAIGYGPHFLAAAGLSLGGVLVVLAYRPGAPDFALLSPSVSRATSASVGA